MDFLTYLQNNVVILDGGMGTLLQSQGLCAGERPETWNITHPDIIVDIHKSYYDAGSNVVCTNTFGANLLKFSKEELDLIIKSAVDNAKKARDLSATSHEKFIALDIGPSGKLLKPFGELDFEDAVSLFRETVKIGVKYGVDLVIIETMNDSFETKAALLAVKENCSLPVIVSNAYGEDGKLMTGATPEAMVFLLEGMGADVIGANCSLGPRQLAPIVEKLLENASVPVVLKANAGLPKTVDGKTVFDIGAEEFASEVLPLVSKGVRVVGGCCGTTPDYIRKLSQRLDNFSPVKITKKDITAVTSFSHAVKFLEKPILIGERINPTGKKRFKQALLENDIDYILTEGVNQEERGVDILDVNVGLPDIDEASVLETVVSELQTVVNLPLQIDTSNPVAMEKALRRYNGCAMINSVNGKKESMEKIFPLVKKYGGVVVALTLDENGIPDTAVGRVDIARKIISCAKEYGIDKKNIVFDTLAMSISADKNAARITLDSLKRIKEELGCHTCLGVSNVSFGLPARDVINSVFFVKALENGLSAAIMNPYSAQMMNAYYSSNALRGLDENFSAYINACENFVTDTAVAVSKNEKAEDSTLSCLQKAITKGFKDKAAALTKELLKDKKALDIINDDIIPALDIMGTGFENKSVFLPQLLMSAEAAKSAFEVIKSSVATDEKKDFKARVVIATVHGDIHDIGKNIVKLLLENYGFDVVDLGKDVESDKIVEAAVNTNCDIVALSALMTTTVPAMEETIKLIREKNLTCKVIVGGAVLTREYADKIGADGYAKDAMGAVRCVESIIAKK